MEKIVKKVLQNIKKCVLIYKCKQNFNYKYKRKEEKLQLEKGKKSIQLLN